jgi:gamma-glutamylcyclotransferase (GGCT)/AIG2-like uncharacterized protein YtfP
LLFAYGTLCKGEPLHHVLRDATFMGERELEGIHLYGTPYDFPAAVRGDGQVRGEVYEVPDAQLERVDKAEGVPKLFKRERVGGYWVYLWARDESELI